METIDINDRIPNSRLTLIDVLGARRGVWRCRCDCGAEGLWPRNQLLRGGTKSCGCLARDTSRNLPIMQSKKHGMEWTSEYRIWVDMRRRCHDPRRPDYKNYGARGITVCEEWRQSFEAFYRDMGSRPEGCTLDRLNNSGPYNKKNCVWATRKEQERNKRSNVIVQVDGERMTLIEACEKYGICKGTAVSRYTVRGWSAEKTFKTPVAKNGGNRRKH